MLLTTDTGSWVPPEPERARCAICHTVSSKFSPVLHKIIDTLTGQLNQRSGSHLESCTTEVRAVRLFKHKVYGDRLVLVDTPGFDDTNKSDLEILELISQWLMKV
jgi:predicted GTPase